MDNDQPNPYSPPKTQVEAPAALRANVSVRRGKALFYLVAFTRLSLEIAGAILGDAGWYGAAIFAVLFWFASAGYVCANLLLILAMVILAGAIAISGLLSGYRFLALGGAIEAATIAIGIALLLLSPSIKAFLDHQREKLHATAEIEDGQGESEDPYGA